MEEPFKEHDAKKRIRNILADGNLIVWAHAEKEMAEDDLDVQDIKNVLWAGRVQEPAEFEKGEWRYRFYTRTTAVILGFDSETAAHVVTAWRTKT